MQELPILLTSAMRVTAPLTALSDVPSRRAATLRAISHWMVTCPKSQFVICDGSGYDMRADLKAIGTIDMSRLEVLTFENDRDKVQELGKGFGEGQIIRHAFHNSGFLKTSESFVKCSGKLWVNNFWSCRKAYNGVAGFSHFGFTTVTAIDTRFFIVRRDFFEGKLLDSYSSCADLRGRYLENVYFDALDGIARRQWLLGIYPNIGGVSGTTGEEYRGGRLKRWGKNLAIQYLRNQRGSRN